jgi:DNA polymerase
MQILHVDIETFSDIDLRKCGVHRYAESPQFEVLLIGVAIDDGLPMIIDLAQGESLPPHIEKALFSPNYEKHAFNSAFELVCLARHFGKPLDPSQWRCTSVHALYLGMPNNLRDVGRIAGIDTTKQKHASGTFLIRKFCIPCNPTKSNGGRTRNLPHHFPDDWKTFTEYCAQDIEAERAISKKISMFPLPPLEQELWTIDQLINNHGIRLDRTLVEAAIACDDIVRQRSLQEAVAITGLANPNSRNQLLAWLQEEDPETEISDLTKKSVPKIMKHTSSTTVQRVLELRQTLAKTSVSKYHAMHRVMCMDDCARGLTQFYGASKTGRWAGRHVQVQNLPKNELPDIDLARQLVRDREFEILELVFGNTPDTLSQLIRTAFIPRQNHKFLIIDFNAIEARALAWLSDCDWRLKVFTTHGRIYETAAERMFGLPPGSVNRASPYRTKGKIAELALGYGGSVGALRAMGALEMGLQEDELEAIKDAWRAANPEIVNFWRSCERAATLAVQDKTQVNVPIAHGLSEIVFSYEKGFLFIGLPSIRRLSYVKPRIEQEDLVHTDSDGQQFVLAQAGSLTYEGIDQKTRQWRRSPTWSGRIVENITQALARDCLREAIFRLHAAGYRILTTIHDEVILEVPVDSDLTRELAEQLMGAPIDWAPNLPLKADGFEARYYQKEIG